AQAGGELHVDANIPVASHSRCHEPPRARRGAIAIHAHGDGIRIDRLPAGWRHGLTRGTWSATADLTGDASHPRRSAHLDRVDAAVGALGGMAGSIELLSDGGPLRLNGAASWHGRRIATLDGSSPRTPAGLLEDEPGRADLPLTLVVGIPSLDLASFPQLVALGGQPIAGRLAGHLRVGTAAGAAAS